MSVVADLKVGMRFTPHLIRGFAQADFTVTDVHPALVEGKLRVTVRGKKTKKHQILVLAEDMEVTINSHGSGPTPRCTCRNHMGTKKQLHKTRQDAMNAILKHHLRHGGHSIYPCPSKLGFHVRSQKLRVVGRSA